jgi:L-fuconolactonase
MASSYVDIHPHIISDDEARYPLAPLGGKRSEWSKERPTTVETMIAAMDEAGVDKAAIVHSSTTYGFDNSYVVDGCAQYPDRLVAVGSVDMAAPDAGETIRRWVDKGLAGLRMFTGGSTKAYDPSELENPQTYPAWELCGELGLSMCIQTGAVGLPQVAALAQRFGNVAVIVDHLARPDLSDGPPYAKAEGLFALAGIPNIYLKLTPRIFTDANKGEASPATFFPRLVEAFGARRIAWGSNYPSSEGGLTALLEEAKQGLAILGEEDRAWIFHRTAQTLYPRLAD